MAPEPATLIVQEGMPGSGALPSHVQRWRAQGAWSDLTLAERARARASADPDALLFLSDTGPIRVGELLGDAEALAVSFTELGLRPGDVISLQLPNWPEVAVINLAASIAGLVVNPIIPIYRDAEVRQILHDSCSRLMFVPERFRSIDYIAMMARLRGDLPDLQCVLTVRGTGRQDYTSLLTAGRGRVPPTGRSDPNSAKLLLYTSGTTGRAKGVLHSHNTISRFLESCAAHWGVGTGDALLMPSPVTHITGYGFGLELPFIIGSRTVLMESWDAAEAIELIERHEVCGTIAATPFLQEMVDAAHGSGHTLPSFRFFACGGAAIPPDLIREANLRFTNAATFRVFGCSELPMITLGWLGADQRDLAATTDGEAIDYEVRVVGQSGEEVPPNSEGELLVRGPAMFLGYADADQTREAITPDGWFCTGDLGTLSSDGAVTVTGRKKDLIIRGGENISAKEIEDVLHRHEAVREAAVVAMPHPRLGEGVCAFILRNQPGVDQAGLVKFVLASGLAKQKCPERFEFIDEFPKTASGKVRKDVLRDWARNGLPASGTADQSKQNNQANKF